MQDVSDLMQRLIDVWAGVEVRVIQDVIEWLAAQVSPPPAFQPQEDIMNIHCDTNLSKRLN